MSGGSMNYLYLKVDEVAYELQQKNQTELRRAFGEHLEVVGRTLRAIEWNDSGDGDHREGQLIAQVLGVSEESITMDILVDDAKAVIESLQGLLRTMWEDES